MIDVISNYVEGFKGEKTTVDEVNGYIYGDTIFFAMPKINHESVHFEQKMVSEFLHENGINQVASPLLNMQGNLTTQRNQTDYIVCACKRNGQPFRYSHGHMLGQLHKTGAEYPYEPQYLSSYGQWKVLWERKIDSYEQLYLSQMQERPVTKYLRLFIDTFPYVIGLSENALQYVQEAESETRYHNSDQGTVVFQRYTNQMQRQIVWSHDLTYDHPVRDVAEYIRPLLLQNNKKTFTEINTFLTEYEQVRPLSVFGWRLLYARLLFPVHLFDIMEEGFRTKDSEERMFTEYKQALEKQSYYEKNLKQLFSNLGIDTDKLDIPVLDW